MPTNKHHITIQVDVDTRHLLTKSTAIVGMSSINSFMLTAAIEKARPVIECEQAFKLTGADSMLLMDALDCPAESNAWLKGASDLYENKIQ